jgi:phosphoglucosamine mutase
MADGRDGDPRVRHHDLSAGAAERSVRERRDLASVPAVVDAMAASRRLGDHGRLLVRYSGTEPLLRVMLEGQHQDEIRRWAEEIVAAVKTSLG